MKQVRFMLMLFLCLCLWGCGTEAERSALSEKDITETAAISTRDLSEEITEEVLEEIAAETVEQESEYEPEEDDQVKILITVGNETLTATPEDNSSAQEFIALLRNAPVKVEMSDYGGMEKVGSLGRSLSRNDKQISVDAGDVILYQGNQITIYYGTNAWNFTRLARIDGATKEGLLKVLGTGDVEVIFSISE